MKRGRPSVSEPVLMRAVKLLYSGEPRLQVAARIGVHVNTLDKWLALYESRVDAAVAKMESRHGA